MWLTRKLGIDKSIAYTSAGQIVSAGGGFLTALFILKCLSGEEQGYYYTFKSILAIQVFFELGMNTVITQYVAHDTAHLGWAGTQLTGEYRFQSRLSSLLHFCAKWYAFFSFILLLTLIFGGAHFFHQYGNDGNHIDWKAPWFILCITTALNLMLTPIFSYLQGLGKVKEVAKYYFYKYTFYLISVLAAFALGAKLYALSIGNIVYIIVSLYFLLATPLGKIIYFIFRTPVTERVSYFKEIFPFQWKIAVSWISGYFIFQLFNPVIFATDGAVAAGQMGMTLTVLTGIQALTYSWTSTKIPTYSAMIEKKQYGPLDRLFHYTVRQAVSVNALCLVVFFGFIFLFRHFNWHISGVDLASRFLPYFPMLLMMIPEFANQFITAWGTYLRCHKQEPFLIYSIVCGALCCISTLGIGKLFGLNGITLGYCAITLALMPWAYYIFKKKRELWHNN
ncbi:MAG: hypothetical protein ILA34_02390 [Bacteroidaceae bacterium]|nr:hypothetical protein [Bacteroidaceae bacterium]